MKELECEKVGRSLGSSASAVAASVFQTCGVGTVALPWVAVEC